MRRRTRVASAAVLAASSLAIASPALADDQDLGADGIVIRVMIQPIAQCVTACVDALPATGGGIPNAAVWVAAALVLSGLLIVLRRRRTRTRGDADQHRPRVPTAYYVVSDRRVRPTGVDFSIPTIPPASFAGGTDRDSERGDPW
ncbi:LPXTG cell wall anchor domain-containing protein [Microbacterium sp. B2969]|uniref:LPXTG cell wall anchor domain-containing protein n=1 Tax=Microbacterium alkaliflavum TaxID=3248839 RepID=A0ABW7Q1M5_9MICO